MQSWAGSQSGVAGQAQALPAQAQGQHAQAAPGIARGLTLDLRVDALGVLQKRGPARGGKTLQGFADQWSTLVPDRWTRRAEGLVQRHALAVLLGDGGEQADLAGQRPENDRRLDPFAAQPFEHAQGMGGFAI